MTSHHRRALDQALAWINAHFEPLGIVASGSIIRGNPHATSDFDLYVVHEKAFRQRVQKRFNEVPCEIFINNVAHVQQYFASELQGNRPVTAHLLATGRVVQGQDNPHILALLAAARRYATLALPLTEEQATFRSYGIATLLEDAADTLAGDEATSCHILDKVIGQVVELVFAARPQPLPRMKERLQALGEADAVAGLLVRQYYQAAGAADKYARAQALVTHVTGARGFFEWSSAPA